MSAYVELQEAEFAAESARLHRHASTSARSAPATSTRSPPRSTPTAPPSPWSDPPRQSSSTDHRMPRPATRRRASDDHRTARTHDTRRDDRTRTRHRPPPSTITHRTADSRTASRARDRRPPRRALRRDPHARGARLPRRRCTSASRAAGTTASPTACGRRFEIGNGRDPRLPRRHRPHPRRTPTGGSPARARAWRTGASRSPARPTRKMTINALNSGAKVWLADQEDATSPTWTNVIEGQLSLLDAIRGELDFTSPEGKEYRVTAERTPDDRDAPARLAPGREAPRVHRPRGPDDARHRDRSSTSGCTSSTTRSALIANGRGPYFYLAKLESQRGGEAVGRRLHVQRAVHRHPARHDPRDRADRDAAGRVRDGGDPLRAARPLRGPQRRALGLHLLDHQELPRPRRPVRAARPQRGHHDRAVHAGVHRAARADLPQARARTRSAA